MIAYKWFDRDFNCTDYTFTEDEDKTFPIYLHCNNLQFYMDIHNIFSQYPPNNSRYAEVNILGNSKIDNKDMYFTNELSIEKELSVDDIFSYLDNLDFSAYKKITKKITYSAINHTNLALYDKHSIVVSTGRYSTSKVFGIDSIAAISGNGSNAITQKEYSIAASTGNYSLINTKQLYSIAASTGSNLISQSEEFNSISASTGNNNLIRTKSSNSVAVATNGSNRIETLESYSIAVSTSGHNNITINNKSIAVSNGVLNNITITGEQSIAIVTDDSNIQVQSPNSIAIATFTEKIKPAISGSINSWLVFISYDSDGSIRTIKSVKVDGYHVEENVKYTLNKCDEIVKCM